MPLLTDFHVFEPSPREVPFSEEAAEVRAERAKARAAGRPLMVLIRPRMVLDETQTPPQLRCQAWLDEADCLVLLDDHRQRFVILKGAL